VAATGAAGFKPGNAVCCITVSDAIIWLQTSPNFHFATQPHKFAINTFVLAKKSCFFLLNRKLRQKLNICECTSTCQYYAYLHSQKEYKIMEKFVLVSYFI
jgi:hypothetical protein